MALQKIGVVGLGLLGRGIVTCLLSRGLIVFATDRVAAVRDSARQHITAAIAEMQARQVVSMETAADWPQRYHEVVSLEQFADCDFVIESVAEDLETKRTVFAQLETVIGSEIPLASNTSALPITLLQGSCRHPERVVGMHWAEPCHLTIFLEVIRGELTNDQTAQAAIELGKIAGKDPALVKKDVPGFIVNRLGYAMYREAFWLLENGVADVETIDRAFRNALSVWANIAGPFRWMDLTGVPAYARVMERLFPELSRTQEVPSMMHQLVDDGALGIANGRGFYEYTPQQARAWEHLWTENVWKVNQMREELKMEEST
ncbi:3-hydroxyacyl-CoA dehydrogenase family protein [Planctomicrobium sp. SH664]|uniref:3-hydroxyacyl-CoA dehydrogenase family protein n=1 Tax=Planctomicrobium sp. SH664 TaxID=3448125 RepID=UPI003F5BD550